MDPITLKIENYRAIPAGRSVEFQLQPDICFILGVNNIGKTSILKLFHDLRPAFAELAKRALAQNAYPVQLPVHGDILLNQDSRSDVIRIRFCRSNCEFDYSLKPNGQRHTNTFEAQHNLSAPHSGATAELLHDIERFFSRSMYIPTLRPGTGGMSGSSGDIQITNNLVRQFDEWSTGQDVDRRKRVRVFLEELRELFGFKRFYISASHDKTHLQVDVNTSSFRLDDLGDGIGHFIVVLTNALFRNPSYILIDEPENGLHPRLQEMFVRSLASKAKHGLLGVSHSIGLARSVADRTYLMSQDSSGDLSLLDIETAYTPSLNAAIHELGYSQFVALGVHNILLVEGRTDIKVFREILSKYGIDQKFLVWDLGGANNIRSKDADIQLQELMRLNAKSVSVIFDSERKSAAAPLNPDLQRFWELCQSLGFRVFATEVHSTENYFCQRAITDTVGKVYTALDPYDNFMAQPRKWDKKKNWLIVQNMTKEEIDKTALGEFIRNELLPLTT